VAAVRALASRPEVIYADEPTGNLDRRASEDLLAFLRRAVTEYGQTVVMVTHDPVAAANAGRVVFLADGRIAGELAEPTAAGVLDAIKDMEA
jgi:putative ABC transport system ATP-binding protein